MPPLKLAIIGAGPSAFYVASRLLLPPRSAAGPRPDLSSLRVHIYDRLWAPHGLVRYGVAPDHPEVKNCTHKFDEVAADPRFRFFGNVNVGDQPLQSIPHVLQVPLSALLPYYSHLLFATGCPVPVLHPSIPPSAYCIPALSLVHWYTRHPSDPPAPALDKLEHIALIGHGNVSLDVARMLLTSPADLSIYDIPQSVLDVLTRSTVKHISIIGRRGPFEVSFTTKELREMMNLKDASMSPIDRAILTPPSGASLTRQQSRLLQLLQNGSRNTPGTTPRSWSLEFFRSPTGLNLPNATSSQATLMLAHTALDPNTRRAVPTGATSSLSTSLVVTSLGFRGEPANAFYDPALGHLSAVSNRVPNHSAPVYASGWAAMGAKGVLASTMLDANDAASAIMHDMSGSTTGSSDGSSVAHPTFPRLTLNPDPHPDDPPLMIREAKSQGLITSYEDWKKVDVEEVKKGVMVGKERERMSWAEASRFLELSRAASS